MAPGRGGLQAPSLGAEGWSSSRTANRDCISAPLVNAGRGDLVLVPEPRMTGASRGSSLVTEAQLNYGDPGQTKEVTTVLPGGMVPFSVANRPPVISRSILFGSTSVDGTPACLQPRKGQAAPSTPRTRTPLQPSVSEVKAPPPTPPPLPPSPPPLEEKEAPGHAPSSSPGTKFGPRLRSTNLLYNSRFPLLPIHSYAFAISLLNLRSASGRSDSGTLLG